MPKYEVTIPVYAHLIYEVEAADPDAAADRPPPEVYTDAMGGLAVRRGRLVVPSRHEAFNFEGMDIEEAG